MYVHDNNITELHDGCIIDNKEKVSNSFYYQQRGFQL